MVKRKGSGGHLEAPPAQTGELVVLEVRAIVHGARGQRGGASDGVTPVETVDPSKLCGGEAPGQGAVEDDRVQ